MKGGQQPAASGPGRTVESRAPMNLWIKVCGLTTPQAVAAAIEAGVSAVGFVFAESGRRVTASQAAALALTVPPDVARVAVMLHPEQASVDEICEIFRPDVLQTDMEDFAGLRVPRGVAVLPVVRADAKLPGELPPRLLFEGPVSGTGRVADWSRARELACRTQLVLAGGLNAANVGEAIAQVRPFGVDVSSGVEAAPGIKDPERIHQFVAAAREAARETGD